MTIEPQPVTQNPGRGTTFSVAFSREEESWTEELDLVAMLAAVLAESGRTTEVKNGWLLLPSLGLALLPQFLDFGLDEEGVAATSTTIEVRAEDGSFGGMFEYQHSRSSESVHASVTEGFRRWSKVDLVVLEDALRDQPEHCSYMKMDFGTEEHKGSRKILLGPVEHYAANPSSEEEEHPFCPCCLFSNSMEGFLPLLQSDGFYAVRMYAARNGSGEVMADCRVNGDDFAAGQEALLQYAGQWPGQGVEYRKQMILICPDPV